MSIFDLFWASNHKEVVDRFNKSPARFTETEDLHYIFASTAMLGQSTVKIEHMLEAPFASIEEFEVAIRRQLAEEYATAQRGVLTQPKFVHKSMFAAGVGLANYKTNFVETGTYTGASIRKIAKLFEHLSTIEASPDLYVACSSLLKPLPNVNSVMGNSRQLLESLTSEYLDQSVVFLDAHYSTGLTSRLYGACPVVEEILILLERTKSAVIVVDDIRTMNGRRGYPSLSKILDSIPSGIKVDFIFDQLIFSPTGTVNYPAYIGPI